jgi:inosose dehydratase
MTITRSQIALNPIQWINLKPEPGEPRVWRYADPAWRDEQPHVHKLIRQAGFEAVMMEVLDTQTLQAYQRVLEQADLRPAPGYIQIAPPEEHGRHLTRGGAEWVRWFDRVRRRAEESNYVGLHTVFLAAEMDLSGPRVTEATAQGAFFDRARLERQTEYLADAAEVLRAEGVRAGLHNHVGSWIETEAEIVHVLEQVDDDLLGASFDIGHLAWVGIDCVAFLERYRDRLIDLHIKDLDLSIAAASRAVPTPYYDVSDQRFFLEPGLGDIDLDGVVRALGPDFGGWLIVEVDRASMEVFESARTSWQWVERTFPA